MKTPAKPVRSEAGKLFSNQGWRDTLPHGIGPGMSDAQVVEAEQVHGAGLGAGVVAILANIAKVPPALYSSAPQPARNGRGDPDS